MITSRRDYILRIIDEVGRLLARAIFKRTGGALDEALEAVVQGCERLFALERDKLFQFTPAQHRLMLTEGEDPAIARDKLFLYAALNGEAARAYARFGRNELARTTLNNALRFTLYAQAVEVPGPLSRPPFAPDPADLRAELGAGPLDPDVAEMLTSQRCLPPPSP